MKLKSKKVRNAANKNSTLLKKLLRHFLDKNFLLLAVSVAGVEIFLIGFHRVDLEKPPLIVKSFMDDANILSSEGRHTIKKKIDTINLHLRELAHLSVIIVPTLQDNVIDGYERNWSIRANDILFFCAPNERKARIDVGENLQLIMTDAVCALIVEYVVFSNFHQNQFDKGVSEGVDIIGQIVIGKKCITILLPINMGGLTILDLV